MDVIYTKDGRPLKVSRARPHLSVWQHVARIRNGKAYGSDGRYVGTIVNDRLIYRSANSATISSPFAPRASAGHGGTRALIAPRLRPGRRTADT